MEDSRRESAIFQSHTGLSKLLIIIDLHEIPASSSSFVRRAQGESEAATQALARGEAAL
jgi:hypothetical protein